MKPAMLLVVRLLAAGAFAVTFPIPADSQEALESPTPKEYLDKSKPLWTKKNYPASENREMLEKLVQIVRENDNAAMNQMLLEGDFFLTDEGIAVFQGMTPEHKEAAHLKWAKDEAAKSVRGRDTRSIINDSGASKSPGLPINRLVQRLYAWSAHRQLSDPESFHHCSSDCSLAD